MSAVVGQRAGAMNALYADLRRATAYAGAAPPRWVVKAYVTAAFARTDRAHAVALAHFGVGVDGLGAGGRQCVRGWVQALADAEAARGRLAA